MCVLHGVGLGALGLGLHDGVMGPLAQAPGVVTGMTVGGDGRVRHDLCVDEALQRFSIVVFRLSHADAAVGFGGDEHQ